MSVSDESSFPSADEANDNLQFTLERKANQIADARATNDEELNVLKLNEDMAKEQLKRLISDNTARKDFSKWIFTLTVIWMFAVLMIIIQCGRNVLHLSNGVLIALITTTTANVFGFFYVVVNYLFNKSKST